MKRIKFETEPLSDTESMRLKIREELADIDINLSELSAADIERRVKALTALFKLTQTIDIQTELDAAKQVALGLDTTQDTHTPYDQIPPPTDAEMCAIRDRLNGLYARLRQPEDPQIGSLGVEPSGANGA